MTVAAVPASRQAPVQPQVAPPGSGPLFGIDVLEVARARQLLERYGRTAMTRIATADEAHWVGAQPSRFGAVLAVKEAVIKALGGRPEPFSWQQIVTGVGGPSVQIDMSVGLSIDTGTGGGWPAPVVDLVHGFAEGLGLAGLTAVGCSVLDAGLLRLTDQLAAAPGHISGAGCFGIRDEHVFALACFWKETSDE